jgi:hypothetical protein
MRLEATSAECDCPESFFAQSTEVLPISTGRDSLVRACTAI